MPSSRNTKWIRRRRDNLCGFMERTPEWRMGVGEGVMRREVSVVVRGLRLRVGCWGAGDGMR